MPIPPQRRRQSSQAASTPPPDDVDPLALTESAQEEPQGRATLAAMRDLYQRRAKELIAAAAGSTDPRVAFLAGRVQSIEHIVLALTGKARLG